MITSYFYKRIGEVTTYGIAPDLVIYGEIPNKVPITEEEYNEAIAELEAEAEAEAERIAAEECSYIEALEAENAALLFQILTGEEYADV